MKLSQALLFSALFCGLTAACDSAATAQQSTPPPPAAPAAQDLPDAPQATAAVTIHPNGPTAVIDTSMGRITCQFYQQQAPKAVANFIALAEGTMDWTDPTTKKKMHHKPYYDNTTFHRVIPEFMVQGGDPTGTGMGDPGFSFDDEFDPNLNFDRPGRLAMANSGPNTNGSVPRDSNDKPVEPVLLKKVTIVREGQPLPAAPAPPPAPSVHSALQGAVKPS